MSPEPCVQRHAQAVLVRERAELLLQTLVGEAAALDEALAREGRGDQMKQITGTNALDGAIRSTENLITCMDSYLNLGVRSTRLVSYNNGHGKKTVSTGS